MNTLKIQEIEDQMSILRNQMNRLIREDTATPSTFYVCTRCGCMYQSIWEMPAKTQTRRRRRNEAII